MKNPVTIQPGAVASGLFQLLGALEPDDVSQLRGMAASLTAFTALFAPVEPVPLVPVAAPPPVEPVVPETRPGKALPAAKERRPQAEPAKRTTESALANRLKLAAALRDKPLRVSDLALASGVTQGLTSFYLKSCPEWFEKTDPANRLATYRLTEAGRAALASSTPTGSRGGPAGPAAGSPATRSPSATPTG